MDNTCVMTIEFICTEVRNQEQSTMNNVNKQWNMYSSKHDTLGAEDFTIYIRDVQNRFFLFLLSFGLVFWKNSDSIRNEFGLVLLKKRGSVWIL